MANTVEIVIRVLDQASVPANNVARGLTNIGTAANGSQRHVNTFGGLLGGLSGHLAKVASLAEGVFIGMLAFQAIRLPGQIISTAVDAYTAYERLQLSLGNLIGVELMNTGVAFNMAEAVAMGAEKAKELVQWTEKLAIYSPFTQEGINSALQQAMGYGIASEKARDLVQAITDYGAATGRTEAQLQEMGFAFGQVYAKGVLRAEEMNRQLTNAGVSIEFMSTALGISKAELIEGMEKGALSAERVLDAFIQLTDERFAGAAARQATSWAGIRSTMQDITRIGLRTFFEGTFKAIQPYFAKFLDGWPILKTRLLEVGDALGGKVAAGLARVGQLVRAFQTGGTGGLIAALGLSPEAQRLVMLIVKDVTDLATAITADLTPALAGLGENVLPLLGQAIQFVADNWDAFKGFMIGAIAVLGSSAVIGAIAGIGAAIVALASPVLVVVAVVGTLAAAWSANWGDIQGKTKAAWAYLQPVLSDLWTWLSANIPAAIQTVYNFVTNTLIPGWQLGWNFLTNTLIPKLRETWEWWNDKWVAAMRLINSVWNDTLQPTFQAIWDFIDTYINPILEVLVDIWLLELQLAFAAVWNYWVNYLRPVLTGLYDYTVNYLGPKLNWLATECIGGVKGAFEAWQRYYNDYTRPMLEWLWGFINDTLGPKLEWLGGTVLSGLKGWWDQLNDSLKFVRDTLQAIKDLFDSLAGAKVPGGPDTNMAANNLAYNNASYSLGMGAMAYAPALNLGAVGMGSGGNTYNYNLHVSSLQSAGDVIQDYSLLRQLAGA